MTADASYGDDDHALELIRDRRDGGLALWESIARQAPDFGRPGTFDGNVDESKWESFTLTMRDPLLLHRIEELTGNLPGTGGLMTFTGSSWLMSIVVPAGVVWIPAPTSGCRSRQRIRLRRYLRGRCRGRVSAAVPAQSRVAGCRCSP